MENVWIASISQIGIYLSFLLILASTFAQKRVRSLTLISGVIFAIAFEHMNVVRYMNVKGGYQYHPNSWGWIAGDVPLYIPLAWGCILVTSRRLTDRLNLKPWARPISDALLTLLIDFSLDIVAIRLHFWSWRDIKLTEGFFGVPADNFFGWLLVSFTFSCLSRLYEAHQNGKRSGEMVERLGRAEVWQDLIAYLLALPALALLLYLALEKLTGLAYWMAHARSLNQQLGVLFLSVFALLIATIFGAMNRKGGRSFERPPENSNVTLLMDLTRQSYHLFGLAGLIYLATTGETRDPVLWRVAAGVWSAEALVLLIVRRRLQSSENSERVSSAKESVS